jgi:hypothetical protein
MIKKRRFSDRFLLSLIGIVVIGWGIFTWWVLYVYPHHH